MQAWTFAACMAGTEIWYLWYYGGRTPADEGTTYANDVVKAGVVASMFWGIAGMLVGLIIALQLSFPHLFYFPDLPWTNFGRMRPLHTSAVIFAFGGNVLIATSYYVVQRTSARACLAVRCPGSCSGATILSSSLLAPAIWKA